MLWGDARLVGSQAWQDVAVRHSHYHPPLLQSGSGKAQRGKSQQGQCRKVRVSVGIALGPVIWLVGFWKRSA